MRQAMRQRLAEVLLRAGMLNAAMRLRRLAFIPPTVSILTYHHIAAEDPAYPYDLDVADASPEQFRRQMEILARHGTPIGMEELLRAFEGEPLPKNPVMVTFDDGYRSCHDVALPILRAVGVRATFFIATSFVAARKIYWWERIAVALAQTCVRSAMFDYPVSFTLDPHSPIAHRRLTDIVKNTPNLDLDRFLSTVEHALDVEWSADVEAKHADNIVMTWDQVRALARAGMDVESHSRRHRVLQTLDPCELQDELVGSRTDLETQLGRPVRAIAYPVGRRVAHHARVLSAISAAGYKLGFTNATGVSVLHADRFDVRRISTDRAMSDAMYFAQVAIPGLAYKGRHGRPLNG